jgi:hypothetical protein
MADETPDTAPEQEVKIKGPTYPIYLYEEGVELPKKGRYYVVTKTGLYFHKETKAGSALVPARGIPWLQEPDMELRLSLPKVPGLIIGQALTFFRKVFELHHSEAYVTLMYSTKLNQYKLHCPKQEVSMASVNYDRTDQPAFKDRVENDWQMVGTIHSHCDFSAYHSGTDVGDEATFDGVHITLGHVNRNQFSMASSVAINDKRETLEPEQSCAGVVRVANRSVNNAKYMQTAWRDETFFFDLELTEAEAQQLVQDTELIETEWMPKVTKKSWGFYQGSGWTGSGGTSGVDREYGRDADWWREQE